MEPVLIYWEFDGENDVPESGVADFEGVPHYFWLGGFGYDRPRTADFDLAPVSRDVVPYVLQWAAIWRRWELAYHGGEVSLESCPTLPEDSEAHQRARAIVDADRVTARQSAFIRVGTFRTTREYLERIAPFVGRRWPVPGWHSADLEVEWTEE